MSAQDYADVYDKAGLLTPKTMLGHSIHLNAREIETIAARPRALPIARPRICSSAPG
jgi:cytosine/adenosine deaminase-related metal-dependent hydrolase